MSTGALDIAARFFAAIEAGDLAAISALYAPEALIWHNTDQRAETVAENLAVLDWVIRTLSQRRYEVQFRCATPDGFAQRHTLRAQLPDGRAFAMPAALFASVAGGRITRIDEYFDSRAADPLRALARPAGG